MNQGELVKLADNILVLIRKKPKQVFEISTVARKL